MYVKEIQIYKFEQNTSNSAKNTTALPRPLV